MIVSYPSGNEVNERHRVSLFVDARLGESESDLDNGFDTEDIFLRKPFSYWIKNEGVVVYSGPHWSEANYGDYFWDLDYANLTPNSHEITFTNFNDLEDYWQKYHFDIEVPEGILAAAALEMF